MQYPAEERNQKIIGAVIEKAKKVCPGSLALIGIYGSFLTGDEVLKKLPELVKEPEDGSVARLYRLPGAQGQVGIISSLSCQFCDRCDRIRLTADGRIKPCLHQQAEYPIKGLDEDGMLRQFEAAIRSKPPCHGELSYAAISRAGRSMNRIGG